MQAEQLPIAFDTQGNLIIPGVHSNNYVPGSSGWTINADGSAEFNNIVIRGGTVVSGLALYYAGTPANGNLIASISALQGTDAFGNTYLSGISSYAGPPSSIYTSINGGVINVGKIVGGVPDTTHVSLITAGNTLGRMIMASGTTALNANPSQVTMIPGNNNVTAPGAIGVPFWLIQSQNGSSVCDVGVTGAVRKTDLLGNFSSAFLPTMGTGWAQGSSGTGAWPSLKYMLDSEDNLHIMGTFNATLATSNPIIATGLPPTTSASGNVCVAGGAVRFVGAANGVLPCYINPMGQLRHQNSPPLTVGDSFMLNAVIPLGNIWG